MSPASDTFPPLVEGELVDDRSLQGFDDDSFGHGDFVRELAGMVCETRTPANIALFGAWGSGKSSIANLLRKALPQDDAEVRFVVFDASKYAQAPLRRHFISQVAHELRIKDQSYHEGLYTGVERRDISFRAGEWVKLAGTFLFTIILTLGLLLLIATGVAAVSAGQFDTNWSKIVKDYLLATLPVAAVIGTFVKLSANGFHINTTRSAPSGDEEFEGLFKKLVYAAKTKRLVVFIDELDRCSPEQVASTLETLKTFLFVPKCAFIVAADQQVLEQALRRKARQHTPEDASNPYYSAGSSYLDKVFQYQLTLPPLRSPTLSRFALTLVQNSPGVWRRIPALDEAVSVLIPTHVVSPRRVKVLLNRFAIAYRVAERRAAEGRLDPDLGARASELAKLVCLQSEFPLFAEELTLDARLPELVRMVADGQELPPNLRADVAQVATEFALGRRIVAELLVDADATAEDVPDELPTAQTAPSTADAAPGADVEPGGDVPRPKRANVVARAHAEQLIGYLRKTRHVAGPGPDLLYLESAGAVHGIDAVRSDQLQRAALNNDIGEVLRLVADAADDNQGLGALRVLADAVKQAQPGIEGRNVVSALLQGIQRSGLELGPAADSIADAIAGHLNQAKLGPDDLLGALTLARASSRAVGPRLLEAVLSNPAAVTRADVAVALLDRAEEVPEAYRTALGTAATTALLGAPEESAARLLTLLPEAARRLLSETTTPLKRTSDMHDAALEAQEKGADAEPGAVILEPAPSETLAAAYDAVLASAGSGDDDFRAAALQLRVEFARLMLALDSTPWRNVVSHRLGSLAPIVDADLIGQALTAASGRATSDWAHWLDPLDASTIGENETFREQTDDLAVELWGDLTSDEAPTDNVAELAVTALVRCAEDVPIQPGIRAAVDETLDVMFTDEAAVEAQDLALQWARRLVAGKLLDATALADVVLAAVAQTLEDATMAPTPTYQQRAVNPTSILAADLPGVVANVLARVQEQAPSATSSVVERILEAVPAATWLSPAERANIQVTAAAALHARDPASSCPVRLDDLLALAPTLGQEESVDDTFSRWLTEFAAPESAWQLVEPLAANELPPKTRNAISEFAYRLDAASRFALIEPALQHAIVAPVHRSFFDAAHLSEVPAHKVAESLGELFGQAQGETGWRAVLEIWQQLSPSGNTSQLRLVDEVYLPLISGGDVGLELAISFVLI